MNSEELTKRLLKALSRKDFLKTSLGVIGGYLALGSSACSNSESDEDTTPVERSVVSIARIKNDNIGLAVEEAIDLLGGIEIVTENKERIMLKPNLIAENPDYTTNPEVIRTLAALMIDAGKDVLIGEGSASANGYNFIDGTYYQTRDQEILDGMQQYVFDTLGYTELASSLGVPLVNLHSGDMVDVVVHGGFLFDEITLHRSLTEIDLLCSVPMMKTHILATVTLGMKNLIGLYPGTVYYSMRGWLHDLAIEKQSPGIAFETVDMVRANKLGLVVVDGSMAMEGDGPALGSLLKMDLIIAGTNPLATDMVAASVMGFEPDEIPTFVWADRAGMEPTGLNMAGIEVRGERIDNVRVQFAKPHIYPWFGNIPILNSKNHSEVPMDRDPQKKRSRLYSNL